MSYFGHRERIESHHREHFLRDPSRGSREGSIICPSLRVPTLVVSYLVDLSTHGTAPLAMTGFSETSLGWAETYPGPSTLSETAGNYSFMRTAQQRETRSASL